MQTPMPGTHDSTPATILAIDDEIDILAFLRKVLEGAGYRLLEARSGAEGLRRFREQSVDLVITDILMPDMDGLELIRIFRETRPEVKILAISGGTGPWDYRDAARMLGADETLAKPVNLQQLLDVVRTLAGR